MSATLVGSQPQLLSAAETNAFLRSQVRFILSPSSEQWRQWFSQ